jgi:uncharacterized protein (TIGR02996 family)
MGGASNTNPGPAVNAETAEAAQTAFLDAILAAREDDGPRLVYADWLSERPDPKSHIRGEQIIVQCRREQLEREGRRATKEYRTARLRERALTEKPIGFRDWNARTSRGFVSQVWLAPDALRTRWEQFRRMPLESITLQYLSGALFDINDLWWLFSQPDVRRLQTVGLQTFFGSVALDPKKFVVVEDDELVWPFEDVVDPRLEDAIVRMHLNEWNAQTTDLVARIAPHLSELSGSNAVLHGDTELPVLRKLSVWVEPPRAIELLHTLKAPNLTNFALQGHSNAHLGALGAEQLARSHLLPQLTNLVADVPLDGVFARALADRAEALTVFAPEGGVTEEGLAVFAASILPSRLRWLSLRNAGEVTFARTLTEAPFERLESLKLEGFRIDEESARAIGNHPGLRQLVDLKLTFCPLKLPAVQALASGPSLENLIEPKFTDCGLTHEAKELIASRWPDAVFVAV